MLPKQWFELTFEEDGDRITDEFVKKYRHCWVWFRKDKNSVPILVQFDQYVDGNFLFLHGDTHISCRLNTDVEILASFPAAGATTFDNTYLVFNRIPARQFKRSPNNENCQLVSPFVSLNPYSFRHSVNFSRPHLEAAYNKEHKVYQQALAIASKEEGKGASLNNRFGITSGFSGSDPIFWYLQYPIGHAYKDKITIEVPELGQEVRDFVRKAQLTGVQIESK